MLFRYAVVGGFRGFVGGYFYLTSMVFAEWTSSFVVETLSFQVLFAHRAIEALTVIVVVQSFNPSVTSFDWEATSEAFGCEELIPIGLAVRFTFFQEEWTVAEKFATIGASEAFGMVVLSNSIQAVTLNFIGAFATSWGQISFEAELAVEFTFLFNKANVLEWTTAIGVNAHEMVRAPDASESGDERSSGDFSVTLTTHRFLTVLQIAD